MGVPGREMGNSEKKQVPQAAGQDRRRWAGPGTQSSCSQHLFPASPPQPAPGPEVLVVNPIHHLTPH